MQLEILGDSQVRSGFVLPNALIVVRIREWKIQEKASAPSEEKTVEEFIFAFKIAELQKSNWNMEWDHIFRGPN